MDFKSKSEIVKELNSRIDSSRNRDEYDEAFAYENFLEWFLERFVY